MSRFFWRIFMLGIRTLYQPDAPGSLAGRLEQRPLQPGPVFAFTRKIGEDDPGFTPEPQPARSIAGQAVPDTGDFILEEVGPGLVRAVFFVDIDGDSLLSAVPVPPDSVLYLEPWALVDSLLVEPGLTASMPAPFWPDTLTFWAVPVDSLAPAAADTLDAGPWERPSEEDGEP